MWCSVATHFLIFQIFLSLSIIALLISIYRSQSAIASTTSLHLSQRLIETFDDVGPKKLGRSLDSRFVQCVRCARATFGSLPIRNMGTMGCYVDIGT
jgi:hypothetical protein